jgi:hypothetical protein
MWKKYSAYEYGRRRGGREIIDDSTGRGYLGNELIRVDTDVLSIIPARDEILETKRSMTTLSKSYSCMCSFLIKHHSIKMHNRVEV